MEAWRDSVPSTMTPNRKQLEGLAVLSGEQVLSTMSNHPGPLARKTPILQLTLSFQVHSLPLESLPLFPAPRFDALFLVKRQWTLEELIPYVDEFVPEGKAITSTMTAAVIL